MKVAAVVTTDLSGLAKALVKTKTTFSVYPDVEHPLIVLTGIDTLLRIQKKYPEKQFLMLETLSAAVSLNIPCLGIRRLSGSLYVKESLQLALRDFVREPDSYQVKLSSSVALRLFKNMIKKDVKKSK
jgi:hypothetical protein